ncbi:MAG TPA: hypothetical protein VFN10_18505 [Thermoanaerobaculia bacterium]|nr:hypothetical protein [Thermoanaerobaculia bacterium]
MDLDERLVRLEQTCRQLRRRANASIACAALLVIGGITIAAKPTNAIDEDAVLRVRGVIITDANGVERVRIGAPLPDPMAFGRRAERLGTLSGILLSDANGTERSGYVTSDELGEVFFTLDASPRQQALFLANAEGGANLSLWDNDGNAAQLAAVRQPILELRKAGKAVVTLPAAEEGAK